MRERPKSLPKHFTRLVDSVLFGNDPSAGSPTETLLRLLLPLNDQVWASSRRPRPLTAAGTSPETSLNHSIGSSDGRCVQRFLQRTGQVRSHRSGNACNIYDTQQRNPLSMRHAFACGPTIS